MVKQYYPSIRYKKTARKIDVLRVESLEDEPGAGWYDHPRKAVEAFAATQKRTVKPRGKSNDNSKRNSNKGVSRN